ncbi:Uncharacterised protein [Mycobacteroides abscessus subsp. abscessus]|nr:Uncharacterised protein [Mycobacteroides abscessus subsp. abscessus]
MTITSNCSDPRRSQFSERASGPRNVYVGPLDPDGLVASLTTTPFHALYRGPGVPSRQPRYRPVALPSVMHAAVAQIAEGQSRSSWAISWRAASVTDPDKDG